MKQYINLAKHILEMGVEKPQSRENMPSTKSVFGYQMRFNLKEGFPILTTKEINFHNIVVELLWFLKGNSNIKYLIDNNVNIWNEDAYNYYVKFCRIEDVIPLVFPKWIKCVKNNYIESKYLPRFYSLGDVGNQYPTLWREWNNFGDNTIDQIDNLIKGLLKNPLSRRHIISAWNPVTLEDMALPACHTMFQFNVTSIPLKERYELAKKDFSKDDVTYEDLEELKIPKYYLDCQLYQRSGDLFLGVPYNISSYSLLTIIIAKICNMVPGEFIHTFGDVHLYKNHIQQIKTQISRECYKLPTLKFSDYFEELLKKLDKSYGVVLTEDCIKELTPDMFYLEDYKHHSRIKGKLSTGLTK